MVKVQCKRLEVRVLYVLRLMLEDQGSKLVGRRLFGTVTSRVEHEAGSKVSQILLVLVQA